MQKKFSLRLIRQNFIRFSPLLENLIQRDLKRKYRASVLGYAWCVLNPLLVMLIMTAVFSMMFKNNIENYPVYMFIGRMFYMLLSGGASTVLRSIVSNGSLMRKTRVPYYIFPLSSYCSALVDFFFMLLAFVAVLIFTQAQITVHIVAFPLVLLEAFVMCFGIGFLLAVVNVFLRDISYLWNVFCTAWLYLSAVFYPLEALPDMLQYIIRTFNPLYFLIGQGRDIFCYHTWPDWGNMLVGFLFGGVMCLLGAYAYYKAKDNLILYV